MKFKQDIHNLYSKSWTNTAAGLTLAGKELSQYNCQSPRILFLTDGHVNKGGNPEPLAERLKNYGIQLDIIGIGGSSMMYMCLLYW